MENIFGPDFYNEKKEEETCSFLNMINPKKPQDKYFNDAQKKLSDKTLNLIKKEINSLNKMIKDNVKPDLIKKFITVVKQTVLDKQEAVSISTIDKRTWPDTYSYLLKNQAKTTEYLEKFIRIAEDYTKRVHSTPKEEKKEEKTKAFLNSISCEKPNNTEKKVNND